MINSRGERFDVVRDGNLSRIVSSIQDEGPAGVDDFASETDGDEEESTPQWDPSTVALLLREAEPLMSARSAPGRDAPEPAARSDPSEAPKQQVPEVDPQPARPAEEARRAKRGHKSILLPVTVLAGLVAGGVVGAIYSLPWKTAPGPEEQSLPASPALQAEIASIKASIASLSKQFEALAAEDARSNEAAAIGAHLDVAIDQVAELERGARPIEGLEARLDELAQRLETVTNQFAEVISDKEPALLQTTVQGPAGNREPDSSSLASRAPNLEPSLRQNTDAKEASPRVAPDVPALTSRPVMPRPVTDADPTARSPLFPVRSVGSEETLGASGHADQRSQGASVTEASNQGLSSAKAQLEQVVARGSSDVASAEPAGAAVGLGESSPDAQAARAVQAVPAPESAERWLQRLATFLEQEVTSFADQTGEDQAAGDDESTVADRAARTGSASGEVGRSGAWFINLIAVRSQSAAAGLQQAYREKGLETRVVPIGESGLFGVRVVGFASRADAASRAAEIKSTLGIREVWIGRS